MPGPIVFISRNRIAEGRRGEFELAYGRGVGLIETTKPETALFAAYLDDSGTEVRVVHAFRDAGAMTLHFEGSEERTQSASDLITLAGLRSTGKLPRRPLLSSVARRRRSTRPSRYSTILSVASSGRPAKPKLRWRAAVGDTRSAWP